MKLVILTRDLEHGGAQRQIIALGRRLQQRGHRVVVAVLYGGFPLERDLQEADIPLYRLNKTGRWDVAGLLVRLVQFLRSEQPDILHGYLEAANMVSVLTKPFFPGKIVWGIRGSTKDVVHRDRQARQWVAVHRRLARFSDLIICNSYAGFADVVSGGVPRDRVIVIPNGIDAERYRPNPQSRSQARATLGVGNHERLLGLVGRLHPMKDHPTFLKAAAMLAAGRTDVRFVCIGTGPASYADRQREIAERLGVGGRVTWAGVHDEMPVLYSALDVLVSSSAYGEGFSNVVAEAMACGVPCVVTDVGDSARIVGETGEVVPPRDPVALYHALARSLDKVDKGQTAPQQLRARITANFSTSSLLDNTERALVGLLARPPT